MTRALPPTRRPARRMFRRTIAFAHALRHLLRGGDPAADVAPPCCRPRRRRRRAPTWRKPDAGNGNGPRALPPRRPARRVRAASLDATLSAMVATAASCERIKTRRCRFHTRCCCTARPTCTASCCPSAWSIDRLPDPAGGGDRRLHLLRARRAGRRDRGTFGLSPNDLPLDAICRAIEIDMRDALGDAELPMRRDRSTGCCASAGAAARAHPRQEGPLLRHRAAGQPAIDRCFVCDQ